MSRGKNRIPSPKAQARAALRNQTYLSPFFKASHPGRGYITVRAFATLWGRLSHYMYYTTNILDLVVQIEKFQKIFTQSLYLRGSAPVITLKYECFCFFGKNFLKTS
jgi:hypothetical protein